MQKIKCEICGTVYNPEEGKCPACGSSRIEEDKPAEQPAQENGQKEAKSREPMDDTILALGRLLAQTDGPDAARDGAQPEPAAPTKESEDPARREQTPAGQEKGSGRAAPPPAEAPKGRRDGETRNASQKKSAASKGPVPKRDKVICGVLGALVVCLGLYIGFRFLRPHLGKTSPSLASEPMTQTTLAVESVPCTGLTTDSTLTLTAAGRTARLKVTATPAGTTDPISYASDTPGVATVSAAGEVVAVAPGQATITVTCGGVSASCVVTCDFETVTTDPTTDESTAPTGGYELDRTDITFRQKGETTRLTVGSLPANQIQWSSDDEEIATVQDGKVTAVAPGTTRVRAVYQGQEMECIVRCNFEEGSGSATLSHTDVTLSVDETFTLRLLDEDGNALDVTWSVGNSNVCTVSGNQVTAVGSGYTEITTTYDGETYTCIARVN